MLGAQHILPQADADAIIDALQGILDDLDSGALAFDPACEDIHMFVEQVLTARIGDLGKKLHTARSRNDQVALDLRMYLRSETNDIIALTKDVLAALVEQAKAHKGDILPGYTHLQRAQPITFGHHPMAYAMMLLRDIDRMQDAVKRMNVSPIGCCASPARRMTPTGSSRPNSSALTMWRATVWTACPTGTSASSCSMLTPSR